MHRYAWGENTHFGRFGRRPSAGLCVVPAPGCAAASARPRCRRGFAMSIVWPCPLTVDAYALMGRAVKVPRPQCPSCLVPAGFWSGYWRHVRRLAAERKIFLRITDLRSRHAYMRVAVATATTPPRQATPTRPARHQNLATRSPVPWPPIIGSRQPASRSPAASPGERSAHLDPGHRSHDPWQLSRTRDQKSTPTFPASYTTQPPQTTTNQAQNLQSLDVPLHMSAQIPHSQPANQQVTRPQPGPPHSDDKSQG